MKPTEISVVIPTINEVRSIAACIESARVAGATQIIVADGGSSDGTLEAARQAGATDVVLSSPGRGVQLNRGAAVARGQTILFLHADNRLGSECLNQICQSENVIWGAFWQRIDSPRALYRIIERGNAMRVTWLGKPFGDQAVFVRRALFEQQGGFAAIPLMEDVELAKRLRRIAGPKLLHGPVTISARRWEESGVLRQTVRNWTIQAAFRLGIPAERLVSYYRSKSV